MFVLAAISDYRSSVIPQWDHALSPIHIQYERFLSGIGGGDDAIAIGYLSGNRCHVARDDMIAISASNVVG